MRLLCCVFLTATISGVFAAQPWWKTATFYQIYPRSFMDYNNDGIGDLKGITSKVDYLADLGINAIWMNPIYPSPLADFGYDVSNYEDIDSMYGTLEDLSDLITALHNKDMKIVLDFVPNHSSIEHPWFNMSANRIGNYTNYYVWLNGTDLGNGTVTVPNNWKSVFQGSMWEWNEIRQQYYLHQFLTAQPDLNFRDEHVVQQFKGIILFWLNLGVDGLRVDAVKYLAEDELFRDAPESNMTGPGGGGGGGGGGMQAQESYTMNLNYTYQIINEWSELIQNYSVADGRDRIIWLEIYGQQDELMTYLNSKYPATMPFNVMIQQNIRSSTKASEFLSIIDSWMTALPSYSTANWLTSSHDQSRASTKIGPQLADAVNMIVAMLPGIMLSYFGEELGMTDTYLTWEETVDPSGLRAGEQNYESSSRDPERTPFQWDDSVNAGFSYNATTWLPLNPNYWSVNVVAQTAAVRSHLKVYKSLMKLRKSTTFLSENTKYQVVAPDENTFGILRWSDEGDTYLLVVNFGSIVSKPLTQDFLATFKNYTQILQNATQLTVNISSINSEHLAGDVVNISEEITFRPKSAVIFQLSPSTSTAAASVSSTLSSSFRCVCASILSVLLFVFSS